MKSLRILSPLVLFVAFAMPAKPATSFSVRFYISPITGTIQLGCETESQPRKTLRCTIDTGAQRSVGDSSVMSKASMRGATARVIQTSAGDQAARETSQVIIVGPVKIPVSLEVTDGVERMDADILIGQDFLRHFSSVKVDYKNHVVIFESE